MSPALTHILVSAWVEEKEGIGVFLIDKRDTDYQLKKLGTLLQ